LHSNRQLRTERDGDTEKGCQNLLYSRRLLMMMMIMMPSCHPTDSVKAPKGHHILPRKKLETVAARFF